MKNLIIIILLSQIGRIADAQVPVAKMTAIGYNEVAICLEWPKISGSVSCRVFYAQIAFLYNDSLGSTVTYTQVHKDWSQTKNVASTALTTQTNSKGVFNPTNPAFLQYKFNGNRAIGPRNIANWVDTLFKLKFPSNDFRFVEASGGPPLDSFLRSQGYISTIWFSVNGGKLVSRHLILDSTALVLPVELIRFNATALDETVLLSWQTASEVNNSHFVLERSKEGLTWESISTIPGSGNSNTILSYQHFDLDPFKARSYYRLKQVDYDGEYAYSDVRVIDFDNELNVTITPNPTRSVLSVNLKWSSGVKTIELSDMKGVRLYHKQAGDQTTFNIDVSQYSPGIYILQIRGDHGKVETRKIIKE